MGYRSVVLLAEDDHAGDGDGGSQEGFSRYSRLGFTLEVTGVTGAGSTLDVEILHSINDGVTWHQLAAFSQTDGATPSTDSQFISVVLGVDPVFIGDAIMARWNTTGSEVFTFGVYAAARS